ncbi:MAG: FAD-dependent oxidoreductase, partial [bacterium]|nr:FAD-dependent oxidoreductase [bacterium]
AAETQSKTTFPVIPWGLPITEESAYYKTRGDWNWETGMNRDQIKEAERIRDHGVRAAYSNWSFLKNHSAKRADYENHRLEWVAHIAGKRESRRLLGDVLLKEQDVLTQRVFPDASVTATWSIDLHYPDPENSKHFPGEEFRTVAKFTKKRPYAIPYRSFYSRNIENLFMAGRNISVTHVALGTIRVQRTTGMMGEVVGMAAALATKHNTTPRGVYENHMDELKEAMERGVGKTALAPPVVEPPKGYELAWSDPFDGTLLDRSQWTYRTDRKHWSTQLRANVAVRDGNLVITANRVSASGGREFTGGGVISKQLFGYGYYESRLRILAGKGWHSSFWLMKYSGDGGTGTDQAELELDVIENDSIDLNSYGINTHRWKGEHATFGHKRITTPLLSDYHVYGCEYTPTTVRYFFDGELVQTVDISSLPQGEVNIWLTSIASHLGNTDAVDSTRLPGHIYFDYVRFYRKTMDR